MIAAEGSFNGISRKICQRRADIGIAHRGAWEITASLSAEKITGLSLARCSCTHTTAECQWMYATIEIGPGGGHARASWSTPFVDGTNQPDSFAAVLT